MRCAGAPHPLGANRLKIEPVMVGDFRMLNGPHRGCTWRTLPLAKWGNKWGNKHESKSYRPSIHAGFGPLFDSDSRTTRPDQGTFALPDQPGTRG